MTWEGDLAQMPKYSKHSSSPCSLYGFLAWDSQWAVCSQRVFQVVFREHEGNVWNLLFAFALPAPHRGSEFWNACWTQEGKKCFWSGPSLWEHPLSSCIAEKLHRKSRTTPGTIRNASLSSSPMLTFSAATSLHCGILVAAENVFLTSEWDMTRVTTYPELRAFHVTVYEDAKMNTSWWFQPNAYKHKHNYNIL